MLAMFISLNIAAQSEMDMMQYDAHEREMDRRYGEDDFSSPLISVVMIALISGYILYRKVVDNDK